MSYEIFPLIFHVYLLPHNIEDKLLNAFHSSHILRVTASSLPSPPFTLFPKKNSLPSLTHSLNHLKYYIPHLNHLYKPCIQNCLPLLTPKRTCQLQNGKSDKPRKQNSATDYFEKTFFTDRTFTGRRTSGLPKR